MLIAILAASGAKVKSTAIAVNDKKRKQHFQTTQTTITNNKNKLRITLTELIFGIRIH